MSHRTDTIDDILDVFASMTLLDLSEFIKAFEERFDVTAAVPGTVTAVAPAPAEPEAEEQTEFTVILEAAGDKKIQVIKEVRTLTKLGLKDAKDLVDGAPSILLRDVASLPALQAKAVLESVGATVTLQ